MDAFFLKGCCVVVEWEVFFVGECSRRLLVRRFRLGVGGEGFV